MNAQRVKWYWDAKLSAPWATLHVLKKEHRLFSDTFLASPSLSCRHSALLMAALGASFPKPGKYIMTNFPSITVTARGRFFRDGKTSRIPVIQERVWSNADDRVRGVLGE